MAFPSANSREPACPASRRPWLTAFRHIAALAVFLILPFLGGTGAWSGIPGCAALSAAGPDREIRTRYFTLIHNEATREAALALAGYADRLYEDLAAFLGVEPRLHLPVYIHEGSALANGHYSPVSQPHIVLYQTHISPGDGFARYNNGLYKLFLHELVHAISLDIGDPWWRPLTGIFIQGGLSSGIAAPATFVEGVTVAFESLDGYGRANDTPYAAVIQQSVIENRFPSFSEASGLQYRAPSGQWYIWGGWFSRFLIQTRGIDSYRDLWKHMGNDECATPFLWDPGAISRGYGQSLASLWEEFRIWMSLKVPVDTLLHPRDAEWHRYSALTARGSVVYAADSLGIHRRDLADGSDRIIAPGDTLVHRLDISADGAFLLVSCTRLGAADAWNTRELRVVDLGTGGLRILGCRDLSEAAWGPDGSILAVRDRGFAADLVQAGAADGRVTGVLYRGAGDRLPSLPSRWGNGGVIFILATEGNNDIVTLTETDPVPRVLVDHRQVRGIRQLWTGDGREALFTWDNDLTLPKLGRLGVVPELSLSLQAMPLSGGVERPVQTDRGIVYVARMCSGQKLMDFAPAPSGAIMVPVDAVPATNPDDPVPVAGPVGESGTGAAIDNAWARSSGATASLSAGTHPAEGAAGSGGVPPEEGPYVPLAWLAVPRVRYPVGDLDLAAPDASLWVKGAGLGMWSIDPSETFTLRAEAGWNWGEGLPRWLLDLDVQTGWGTLGVNAGDSMTYQVDSTGRWKTRILRGGLDGSWVFPGLTAGQSGGLDLFAAGLAWGSRQVEYLQGADGTWSDTSAPGSSIILSHALLGAGISASWQDLAASPDPGTTRGWSVSAGWQGIADPLAPDLPEGVAQMHLHGYLPGLGAETAGGNPAPGMNPALHLTGALATHPRVRLGTSRADSDSGMILSLPDAFSPWGGYETTAVAGSPWYAGADVSLGPTLEVNAALPFMVYLESLTVRAGYRGAWAGGTGGRWLDTVWLSLVPDLRVSDTLVGIMTLRAGLEAGYNLRDDRGLYLSFLYSVSY